MSISSATARVIHDELKLYRSNTHFIFLPKVTQSKDTRCLALDRVTCALSLENWTEDEVAKLAPTTQPLVAYGIVGFTQLYSGTYLLLITNRALVGIIDNEPIYKITEVNFIQVSPTPTALSDSQKKQENAFLGELNKLLTDRYFFFSYTYDLSNSLQRRNAMSPEQLNQPLYKRFDNRFFWNKSLVDNLTNKSDLADWVLPLLRGKYPVFTPCDRARAPFFNSISLIRHNFFFGTCSVQVFIAIVQRRSFDFLLISRRSRFRAGTRYKTRGVDQTGSVANYVETEQIVRMEKHWLSFVQTRGSIPLLWGQSGVKYTPVPRINPDKDANQRCFLKHIQEQLSFYEGQLIVNLLDQRGVELELSNMWQEHVARLNDPNVVFEGYDFHLKCKSSYDNVAELIDKLRPNLEKMSYFHSNAQGDVLTRQTGAVRTNCLDCLDRTNLVQSYFGRHALAAKLRVFGIDYFDAQNAILERIFKEAWANNGDAVSLQYAGTAALKSDFTRTGQRETKGVLKDGVNSLSRYWMNTFRDNMRQLGIDLFLGIYDLRSNATHDDLDDDIVSQSGLWNEQQLQAIEACTTFLEQEELKNAEEEDILNAYVVISVNKFGAEQERVLAVTNQAVYRFKYNYNNNKNPIDHFKRLPLAGLKAVQIGPISNDKKQQQYGIVLDFGESEKSQHIYSALDLSKENAERIVEAVAKAVKSSLNAEIVVKQIQIQRQTSFGSGIFNALGLGMYNKGKKDDKSSSSSSSAKGSPEVSKKDSK